MRKLGRSETPPSKLANTSALADSEDIDLDDELRMQALEWQVLLWSGEVSAAEQQDFQTWLNADETHRKTWEGIQQINRHFDALPHLKSAATALRASRTPQKRRNILRSVALLFGVVGCGYAVRKTPQWQIAQADLQTDYGITKTLTLSDGSLVKLNSATAINLAFSEVARRLYLLRGEVFITTAANGPQDQVHRPFLVETAQGCIKALGTKFNVKALENSTVIGVIEGMVEIQTAGNPQKKRRLEAGEQTRFTPFSIDAPQAITGTLTGWIHNRLVVEQVSLQDFAKELERYRRGIVQVDPAIAHLQISGSFALHNTDQVLQSLTYSHPVKIRTIAPLWVRIVPA